MLHHDRGLPYHPHRETAEMTTDNDNDFRKFRGGSLGSASDASVTTTFPATLVSSRRRAYLGFRTILTGRAPR